jgi:hypothetical protein
VLRRQIPGVTVGAFIIEGCVTTLNDRQCYRWDIHKRRVCFKFLYVRYERYREWKVGKINVVNSKLSLKKTICKKNTIAMAYEDKKGNHDLLVS